MLQSLNLYAIRVSGDGGQIGSFFAAAVDLSQARAIGQQWASEKGFDFARVDARRHVDPRPVYALN